MMAQKQGIQNQQERDAIRYAALRRIAAAEQTLNPDKDEDRRAKARRSKRKDRHQPMKSSQLQPLPPQLHRPTTTSNTTDPNRDHGHHRHHARNAHTTSPLAPLPPASPLNSRSFQIPVEFPRLTTQARRHSPPDHGSNHCPCTRTRPNGQGDNKGGPQGTRRAQLVSPTSEGLTHYDSMHGQLPHQRTTDRTKDRTAPSVVSVAMIAGTRQ